ncbi:hypothetical protein [Streptomyces albicerus]|uniref:hypothetical protein n=1 Tax=Streptomyces albicerus TaxID=2569859 RepID=UPI001CEDE992|nr:hypothetical protein [Streptomyces albicerus]
MSDAHSPAEQPQALVHLRADRELAAGHWLLSAHPTPGPAREAWSKPSGIVVLPLGTLFSAVRIPNDVVHSAAGSGESSAVDAFLADCLSGGPVIRDPTGCRYYALVPASTQHSSIPGADCLGRGTYLGVPRLDQVELDARGWRSYWSVPMASPGELCDPRDVARLVLEGIPQYPAEMFE